MRIEIVRHGGFAGITKRISVDTSSLPPAEAARLEELARSSAGVPPAGQAPSRRPDQFHYRITIDGTPYEVTNPTGVWKSLLDALHDLA